MAKPLSLSSLSYLMQINIAVLLKDKKHHYLLLHLLSVKFLDSLGADDFKFPVGLSELLSHLIVDLLVLPPDLKLLVALVP